MDTHKNKESQEAARKRKYCGCAEYSFPEAAVVAKYQRLGDLHNRNIFSHGSGGWKSEIKVSAGPCSLSRI